MIQLLFDAWPMVIAMGVLILLSAFFSGSEAALFSLTARDRKLLSRQGIAGRTAVGLLETPERILSAILFWNLLINMTYFAIAAILGGRMEQSPDAGRSSVIIFTVISLLSIIFFSEMLPKSFAVIVPRNLSLAVAIPLSISLRLVSPILPLVTKANLVVTRLVWPGFQPEPEMDLSDIERAIELGTDDAALLQREKAALSELVQIADTRASELMRPRSKLWVTPSPIQRAAVLSEGIRSGFLMVTDAESKMIVGAIRVRTLRPSQLDDLNSTTEPVIHVPWSAMISQVLDQLNQDGRSVAIVVNEFGETVGAVTIDDILRRVLAPRHEDAMLGESTIQVIGDDHYRVWGLLSLRQLSKQLDVDVDGEGITTVAGYIGRKNERLARVGDSAVMGEYRLTVIEQFDPSVWIEVVRYEDQEAENS